jgi:hypothetical protein
MFRRLPFGTLSLEKSDFGPLGCKLPSNWPPRNQNKEFMEILLGSIINAALVSFSPSNPLWFLFALRILGQSLARRLFFFAGSRSNSASARALMP